MDTHVIACRLHDRFTGTSDVNQRALKLPSISQTCFWLDKSSENPSPAVNFKSGISLKRFRYLPVSFPFRPENRTRKKNYQPGEGFVKICQKARMEDRGELAEHGKA